MGKRAAAAPARAAAWAAAIAAGAISLHALRASAVVVEQIEAYEDKSFPYVHFTPIDFAGQNVVTVNDGGIFNGVTFHALNGNTNTVSKHAGTVGSSIYGSGSAGAGYVTDVYSAESTNFIWNTAGSSNVLFTNGPAPGHFAAGAQVVNNSYIASISNTLDAQRRIDFMIDRDDVTFVASAANPPPSVSTFVTWSSYNALAVRGSQSVFDPTLSPGKTHADLGMTGYASFTAAAVSGYAAGLYGQALAAGQTDAAHSVVMRSLLMAGADKTTYARQTANNLDKLWGAGQANYGNSLDILQNGEINFSNVATDGVIRGGTTNAGLKGWTYANVAGGSATQSAVVVHVPNAIRAITASLNWNVTQSQQTSDTIDTTAAGVVFPNLSLELRPVNVEFTTGGGASTSHVELGQSLGDPTLTSAVTNDNVQYLYSTNPLPAGDYAFVITGDPAAARSAAVGFSYNIAAEAISRWTGNATGSWSSNANWTSGVPTYAADRATLVTVAGATTPVTITLDGNRTVGQVTFGGSGNFTINTGAGTGALIIDDTGDDGGVAPTITVNTGNQLINSRLTVAAGVNINTAAASSLTIAGKVTGAGGIIKTGAGALTLSAANNNFGDVLVQAGSFTFSASASTSAGNVTVSPGATANINGTLAGSAAVTANGGVNFAGNASGATATRTQALAGLQIGSGATVTVTASASATTPTILVPAVLSFAAPDSTLNLTNNQLITSAPLAGVRAWIISGQITGLKTAMLGLGFKDLGTGQTEVRDTLLGDCTLDGQVDVTDLGIFTAWLGTTSGATWAQGDFNNDGAVDLTDLGFLATGFSHSLATLAGANRASADPTAVSATNASVPEPTALGATIALVLIASRRRRR